MTVYDHDSTQGQKKSFKKFYILPQNPADLKTSCMKFAMIDDWSLKSQLYTISLSNNICFYLFAGAVKNQTSILDNIFTSECLPKTNKFASS